jgi:hypothetical protein
MVRMTSAADGENPTRCSAEGLAMGIAAAPSIRRVCLAALLAAAALPLVIAAPASARPYPLPGIGTGTFTAPAVEPAPVAQAMQLEEGARCRGEVAALVLQLREAGMSPQGASYVDYLLAETCEERAEAT